MEKMVIELIRFLQKWGLWQDVTILADGKAYFPGCNKEDVYCGLPNVKITVCENPEDYTTGITDETDCYGNCHPVWKNFSNPEHILDMVYEGPLYMVLRHDTYEGVKKSDISPDAWEYIFAHTKILEDYMYEKYELASPEELLAQILEDRLDNSGYTAWDPLVFDTWEEYQEFVNGEAYENGEERLTPIYQRYGTYEEYLTELETSESLSIEDIKPVWEQMVSDAKTEFIRRSAADKSGIISISEIAGYIKSEFDKIFDRYGLWYDFGFAWSLTCYKNE
ncbi:MAG: hypothetical protein SPL59_04635 [Catonella sp.]|nr:hypothetical protein [Lachnospiraceae bacterium]MDY6356501.1 hypothetical protein [Catonella sp.]